MRKLLTFLIALAAIVFAVSSPASAQCSRMGGGVLVCNPAPSGAAFSFAWVSHAEDSAGGTPITYSSLSFGAADPNRIVAVAVVNRSTGAPTIAAMTIGGISATQVASAAAVDSGSMFLADVWQAAVPTGTSGNVAITYGVSSTRSGIDLYRIVTTSPTAASANGAFSSSSATDAPISTTVTIPSGGAALSVYGLRGPQSGTPSITWTNASSDNTATNIGGANFLMVGSAKASSVGSTTISGQTTGNNNGTPVTMSSAAWGP